VTATGLFLGAGASFEAGMPLVWDLTAEISAWLTPEKLRELNAGWRDQGTGNPDAVIDSLVASLLNPSMHYQSILGNLEVQFLVPGEGLSFVAKVAGERRHGMAGVCEFENAGNDEREIRRSV
jgi:hypothetical protein